MRFNYPGYILSLLTLYGAVLCIGTGCKQQKKETREEWIQGSEDEKLRSIEQQFRGFDVAMVEVGYRYQELYWAGQDANWPYAHYQIDKMRTVIELGLQRRPKRSASARNFLSQGIPEMKTAIQAKDTGMFTRAFKVLTQRCNACHAMENVPFFTVNVPLQRQSPIRVFDDKK